MDQKAVTPSYLRARMDVFRQAIAQAEKDDPDMGALRSGVMRDQENEQRLIATAMAEKNYPGHPLSFLELTSFNTWFVLHPEKICGEEIITTSREFPVSVKGSRRNIEATIEHHTGEDMLILPVPFGWRLGRFEPLTDDFYAEYEGGYFVARVYDSGATYHLAISEGDRLVHDTHYTSISEANLRLMEFMRAHPGSSSSRTLELEALALELELQISDL